MIFSIKNVFTPAFIVCLCIQVLLGQGKPYAGPEDPAGDIAAEREGFMTGNRILLFFQNTTELSDWPATNVSRWPNNNDGLKMIDGIGLLIGAKVFIKDDGNVATVDTIPLTEPADIVLNDHHELYYLQTSYREEMDMDPTGTVQWGFFPVFGYFNEVGEYPGMSNRPETWPPNGWPAQGLTTKWPGEWDGRFGRGVIYADLETYFVVNDAQDQENLGLEDMVKYYPRPGKFVGDLRPNVTLQPGVPWGGLGLRVEVRGFQWNNPQARDAIFWEYSIANISNYDLREVAFGYWVDNGIGDDGSDDLGYFNTDIDMAYSWDINGIGSGGKPTGVMGFAYLESPGMGYDAIDNDHDGLVDELRDNDAQMIIGPTDGISDVDAFLEFYKLNLEDLRDHWDADEDQDWEDGNDANGDGIYQLSEYAGDDIGVDGVGPSDLNYTGPDADGSECNHRPDYVEGIGSEPNFNATDVSESDMVGLTAFRMFPIPSHAPANETYWFKNDKAMWELIGEDSLEEFEGNVSNLVEVFASGPFPLYQGRVERISMSELHSYDALAGLNSGDHSAPALYELKRIVQIIYEKDYRFAQPPKMPTLASTAGDGEVILTWDNIADTRTRDPFVGNINDFEGYKVFRATDKYFSDSEVITDGFGTPMFKKPIFQCDLVDGLYGFTDFGLVNGAGYNLGTDSGITHVFIDNTVENGRTYYYAVVAYDYGAPDIGPGITPSENNVIIELDEAESIRFIGQNVAIVVPHQSAAGYVPPEIQVKTNEHLFGTGAINPKVMASGSLKSEHEYLLTFGIDTIATVSNYDRGILYTTNSFSVYDATENYELVYEENPENYIGNNLFYRDTLDYWTMKTYEEVETDAFDGIQLAIQQDVEIATFDYSNSGWITGSGYMNVIPSIYDGLAIPWDYKIIFTGEDSAYVGVITNKSGVRDELGNSISRNDVIVAPAVDFYVVNESFGDLELMDMIIQDMNDNDTFELFEDRILVGAPSVTRWQATAFVIDFSYADENTYPDEGDVYSVTWKRPFFSMDSIRFTVSKADSLDAIALNSEMDNIKVVPNPYVMTNMMEEALSNPFLNQRRKLMFTHIPAECTIHIFTVSGVLVDKVEVNNEPENGIVHWDMLTREGLEIAAGMYLYHIKSNVTGDSKVGKFAVIK